VSSSKSRIDADDYSAPITVKTHAGFGRAWSSIFSRDSPATRNQRRLKARLIDRRDGVPGDRARVGVSSRYDQFADRFNHPADRKRLISRAEAIARRRRSLSRGPVSLALAMPLSRRRESPFVVGSSTRHTYRGTSHCFGRRYSRLTNRETPFVLLSAVTTEARGPYRCPAISISRRWKIGKHAVIFVLYSVRRVRFAIVPACDSSRCRSDIGFGIRCRGVSPASAGKRGPLL